MTEKKPFSSEIKEYTPELLDQRLAISEGVSVVLPTRNESANVAPISEAIITALHEMIPFEIIFVDDSTDDTPEKVHALSRDDERIRLIHRSAEERSGLATAVAKGFRHARGKYVVCMDADLQHPPETIVDMIVAAERTGAEVVVASRYIPGGSAEGLGTKYRRFVSLLTKYVSYLFLSPTRKTTDPSSGYFLFERKILENDIFRPRGFKILIELLARLNPSIVADVPFVFLPRANGASKASLNQGKEFFQHLFYLACTAADAGRFFRFSVVGITGVIVNLCTIIFLVESVKMPLLNAWWIAVLASIIWNFIFNTVFTFFDRRALSFRGLVRRFVVYAIVSFAALIINYSAFVFTNYVGAHYIAATCFGIITGLFFNYLFSATIVWTRRDTQKLNASHEGKPAIFQILGLTTVFVVLVYWVYTTLSAWGLSQGEILQYVVVGISLFLVVQGLFALFLMLYAWENPKRFAYGRSPKEFYSPQLSFSVLVPVRQEAEVIASTIRAISRIDYPEHLVETLVICSDDDVETIEAVALAQEKLNTRNVRQVIYNEKPINKPHGLNQALKVAVNDVVVIFDAEDEPHHDIFNVANTVMVRDDADVVQSGVQLMNYRSTWFSMFNVMEYYFWFKSAMHFFARIGTIPLGGNTVFFDRDVLNLVGGWDHFCLTEDADVGIRLSKIGANVRVVYDEVHATQEETPPTMSSFIKQRTRWNHGFLQILFKKDWMDLPSMRKGMFALYIFMWPFIHALLFLYIPFSLWLAFTYELPVALAMITNAPLIIILLHFIIFNVGLFEFTRDYKQKYPFWFPLKSLIFYIPYQIMLGISAFRAAYRFLKGDLTWEKTEHINAHRSEEIVEEEYNRDMHPVHHRES